MRADDKFLVADSSTKFVGKCVTGSIIGSSTDTDLSDATKLVVIIDATSVIWPACESSIGFLR